MNTPNTSSTINRHHWIVAPSLAALTCGVSCEEAEVETNDQKLLALCKKPKATTEAIEVLLKAGADAKAKDKQGKTAADHAKDNEKIYKTKVYWKLNEARYE